MYFFFICYYKNDVVIIGEGERHYQGCTNSRFAIRICICVYMDTPEA